MQQIIPFVFHANANATPAGGDRADFVTVHHTVLAKVDSTSTIKRSDVVAFVQVSTKRNPTTSACFTGKRSESGSIVDIL